MGMNLEEAFSHLGIHQGSEEDDIRRAYKKLALATHPDKNPDDPDAKVKFQKISEAYNRIINAEEYSSSGEYGGSDDEGCQCCQCRGHRFHMSEEEMYAMFNFIFRGGPPFTNFSFKGRRSREEFFGPFDSNMDSDSDEDLRDCSQARPRGKKKEDLQREALQRQRYEEEQARLRAQRLKEQEERRRLREERRKEQEELKKKAEMRKQVEQELARQKKEAAAAKRREERMKKMQEKEDKKKYLFDACLAGDLEEVIRLIEKEGVKCYERNSENGKEGASLLHLCVQAANSKEAVEMQEARFKIAEFLLKCDGSEALDWGWADESGMTVLHKAALLGDFPLLAALLRVRKSNRARYMQLDINGLCVSERGWSALHYAAQAGHRDIISSLLEHGAKVKILSEPPSPSISPVTAAEVVMQHLSELPADGHGTNNRRAAKRCLRVLEEAALQADRRKAHRMAEDAERKEIEAARIAHDVLEKEKVENELLQKKQKQLREKLARQLHEQDENNLSAEVIAGAGGLKGSKKKKKKDRRVKSKDGDSPVQQDTFSFTLPDSKKSSAEKGYFESDNQMLMTPKRLAQDDFNELSRTTENSEDYNGSDNEEGDGSTSSRPSGFRPRVPCHFYAQGKCTRGDGCNFLHELGKEGIEKETVETKSRFVPRIPCHFFAQGKCNRGEKCTFLHTVSAEDMPSPVLKQTNMPLPPAPVVSPVLSSATSLKPSENPWNVQNQSKGNVHLVAASSEFPALGSTASISEARLVGHQTLGRQENVTQLESCAPLSTEVELSLNPQQIVACPASKEYSTHSYEGKRMPGGKVRAPRTKQVGHFRKVEHPADTTVKGPVAEAAEQYRYQIHIPQQPQHIVQMGPPSPVTPITSVPSPQGLSIGSGGQLLPPQLPLTLSDSFQMNLAINALNSTRSLNGIHQQRAPMLMQLTQNGGNWCALPTSPGTNGTAFNVHTASLSHGYPPPPPQQMSPQQYIPTWIPTQQPPSPFQGSWTNVATESKINSAYIPDENWCSVLQKPDDGVHKTPKFGAGIYASNVASQLPAQDQLNDLSTTLLNGNALIPNVFQLKSGPSGDSNIINSPFNKIDEANLSLELRAAPTTQEDKLKTEAPSNIWGLPNWSPAMDDPHGFSKPSCTEESFSQLSSFLSMVSDSSKEDAWSHFFR